MNNRNYAEKVRRRKQGLKQIDAELNSTSTKRRKSWIWVLITCLLLGATIFSLYLYKEFSVGWSNYENLMLPIFLFFTSFVLWGIWFLPKLYVRSLLKSSLSSTQSEFDREKERLKLEDDTRKTIAQVIGGAILLLGTMLTFSTYRLNVEKQDIDRAGQITDRFSRAVLQLGEKDLTIRIGGLYALERIAKDSPKEYGDIMEILSAYIREKSPKKRIEKEKLPTKENNSTQSEPTGEWWIAADIQVALDIIGRRHIIEGDRSSRDLAGTNLSGAKLSGNFRDTKFDSAVFNEANLSYTILQRADFRFANLRHTNLKGADLSETNFLGAIIYMTDFRGANLALVKNLTFEKLARGIIDEETILPESLKPHRQALLDISKENFKETDEGFWQ